MAVLRARVRRSSGDVREPSTMGEATATVVGCAAILAHLLFYALPAARLTYANGLFDGMTRAWFFPGGAVEFLRRNPLPARLFHMYPWGGYLMYHLPERPVFIDPRAQTLYPAAFFRESVTAEYAGPQWGEILDRYQVSLVLWPSGRATDPLHRILFQDLSSSPDWQRIYDDEHSTVFAHRERGRAWIEKYRAFELEYPDTPGAQLFLANAYLDADQFGAARTRMRDAVRRFPSADLSARRTEQRLLAAARSSGSPEAWFGVGFCRDVRDQRADATAAYRTALQGGLTGPQASYAREAIARAANAPAAR